ncbi:hypothetical protein [Capnocytophaga canis]|uniref:hypothetical protein n=1 Tax=Capnocytophaga canis TaxID=1848903 RepID=UPI001561F45A|nr:hypothetical protein [Capnocytophaga canis]GIM60398.1 hypothetical protein CAPN008_04480 [Capnocytophaga canis]
MERSFSDYIAFLSFGVSLIVGAWQIFTYIKVEKQKKRLDQQQELLNEYGIKKFEQEKEDRKKADLLVKCRETTGSDFLQITNIGKSPALNVVIHTEGLEEKGYYFYDNTPFPVLNPQESFQKQVLIAGNAQNNPIVLITWDDEFKKNNKKEVTLTF